MLLDFTTRLEGSAREGVIGEIWGKSGVGNHAVWFDVDVARTPPFWRCLYCRGIQ